jgi:hypothetical protein
MTSTNMRVINESIFLFTIKPSLPIIKKTITILNIVIVCCIQKTSILKLKYIVLNLRKSSSNYIGCLMF